MATIVELFSSWDLILSLRLAWSETSSAIISLAHWIASSKSFTAFLGSLSFLINSSAFFWNSSLVSSALARIFANGSNHFAFAIVALVFFFSLNGLYKSSTLERVSASIISFFNSGLRSHFSSIRRRTASFLASRFLVYVYTSLKSLSCSSVAPFVISLR